MIIRSFIVLSALLLLPQTGWAQLEVDFSNYDVPLYAQIVNRIKAKVSARLGEGRNPHDRYFIIPFAYQESGKRSTILAFVYHSDPSVCR